MNPYLLKHSLNTSVQYSVVLLSLVKDKDGNKTNVIEEDIIIFIHKNWSNYGCFY